MKIAHRITLIALLWLIFINPGNITIVDTVRRMEMAHAWWTGMEESFSEHKIVVNINGKNYIPYDLGQSMLMLPGDWLGTKLGQNLNLTSESERQYFTQIIISFFIFLPINLLAVLACFRLLRLFNYSEKLAELSSIIWLLGTSVLFYSKFHQQNNQILLFVLISYGTALAYTTKQKKHLAILSGITLGIAFLIRITSILHAVSLLVFIAGCISYQHQYKFKPVCKKSFEALTLWMAGFVPFILLERILTYYRYGSWTATSTSLHLQIFAKQSLINPGTIVQGEDNGFSFLKLLTKIQPEALLAPLFSPEKSIFLYDPLVLPCFIIAFLCWKYLSPYISFYLIANLLSFLLHLYIYSWTSEWIQLSAWGARYHITSIHLLLVPLIPLLIRGATIQINKKTDLLKSTVSWIAKIIIIIAILIQFSSIVLPHRLETNQQELGVGSRFRVAQRIKNIFYVFNYDKKPSNQISKVLEQSSFFASNKNIPWDLFPSRIESRLKDNSSLNKITPILYLLWSVIFIFALTTTVAIFIK